MTFLVVNQSLYFCRRAYKMLSFMDGEKGLKSNVEHNGVFIIYFGGVSNRNSKREFFLEILSLSSVHSVWNHFLCLFLYLVKLTASEHSDLGWFSQK